MIRSGVRFVGRSFWVKMAYGKTQRSFNSLEMAIMLEVARRIKALTLVMAADLLLDLLVALPPVRFRAMAVLPRCLPVMDVALWQTLQATVNLPVLLLLLLHMPLLQVFATLCAVEPEFMAWAMWAWEGTTTSKALVLQWVACKVDLQ
jgi:hypothetical protein